MAGSIAACRDCGTSRQEKLTKIRATVAAAARRATSSKGGHRLLRTRPQHHGSCLGEPAVLHDRYPVEPVPPGTDLGVQVVRQFVRPGCADRVKCGSQVGVGSLRLGDQDLVPDRPVEHVLLLGHQDDVAARLPGGQVRYRHLAHGHRTGIRMLDPGQQPAQGGLARTRWPGGTFVNEQSARSSVS
jgi:hypothetical protein